MLFVLIPSFYYSFFFCYFLTVSSFLNDLIGPYYFLWHKDHIRMNKLINKINDLIKELKPRHGWQVFIYSWEICYFKKTTGEEFTRKSECLYNFGNTLLTVQECFCSANLTAVASLLLPNIRQCNQPLKIQRHDMVLNFHHICTSITLLPILWICVLWFLLYLIIIF